MGIRIASFLVLVLLSSLASGQGTLDTNDVTQRTVAGNDFKVYKVKPGNTLFSVSKAFNTSLVILSKYNPGVKDGLSIDEEILIPDFTIKSSPLVTAAKQLEVAPKGRVHIVKPKETLFGISRKYSVEIFDLKRANPNLETNGLQIGMELNIPNTSRELEVKNAEPDVVPDADSLKRHLVKKKETLYSISKLYAISMDSIVQLNPEKSSKLKSGMSLRIPVYTETYKLVLSQKIELDSLLQAGVFDSVAEPDIINVTLMLPLYLDQNDTIENKRLSFQAVSLFPRSIISMDFLSGFLLAFEEKNSAKKINLTVYDTDQDTAKVTELLAKPEMENQHLFIGPLYKSNFEMVSRFAKYRGKNIISPVPQSNKILLGNPSVSKVYPSLPMQVNAAVKHIKTIDTVVPVLINSMKLKDQNAFELFKKKLNFDPREPSETAAEESTDSIKELVVYEPEAEKLESIFEEDTCYLVIIPSDNQAFVSEFLTQLYNLKLTGKRVIVMGMENWKRFENIDPDVLHGLQVHQPIHEWLRYDRPEVKTFIQSFRDRWDAEPNNFGFLGYDIGTYYFSLLNKYGLAFPKYYEEERMKGLTIGFDFFKTSEDSGFENRFIRVVNYDDYKLKQVN